MRFITLLFSALLSFSTSAEPLTEADDLKRVLLEIEALKPLIEEAQRRSDHQDRLRFNYRCLITDLNLLKHGLRSAIYTVKHQPRQYQALCGDYGYSGPLGGESENLSMLVNELQSLIPIIHQAKLHGDPSSRIQINYQALESDLDTMISALQKALMGAGDQPRSFPALRGAFSQ